MPSSQLTQSLTKFNMFFMLVSLSLLSLSACQTPDQFSWDNYNNINYLPEIHSQNYPQPCQSGWAFSAVDVLNSRLKIKRKAASPDI